MSRTVDEVAHTEVMMRKARLAERERCAKIAEGAMYVQPAAGSQENAWNDACEHIAEGIRRKSE